MITRSMTQIIEEREQRCAQPIEAIDGLQDKSYGRKVTLPRDSYPSDCFSLTKKEDTWLLSSSYFIGIDWLEEGQSAIRILPKFNTEDGVVQVDYLSMLKEALTEPKNLEHLGGLLFVDFNRPCIDIPQQDDALSLFLASEFLSVMSAITKKGLKKAYYQVEENLRAKIKGKVLVDKNVKKNHVRGNLSNNYCRYQEYGVDIPENRLLKAALVETMHIVESYKKVSGDIKYLTDIVRAITPRWAKVSINTHTKFLREGRSNAFYKEYPIACHLAQLILKRASINHIQHGAKTSKTPPYWIDMSKLFEMYVLKLLRKRFDNQVEYHVSFFGKQEPDYLLHGDEKHSPYIVDAKYKRYSERTIEVDDIRQVSGYARLKTIRKRLNVQDKSVIPCLFVYPDLNGKDNIPDYKDWEEEGHYEEIYKVGIQLPLI